MSLIIYEVIAWGGDGQTDTVFLVSARDVQEAAGLVDEYQNKMLHSVPGVHAQTVCEIAPDPRSGNPTIVLGPCHQFAYDYGWKKWERDKPSDPWKQV